MPQLDTVQYPNSIPVKIESIQFPGNLLRMAGTANHPFDPSGFGQVNCQADTGNIDANPDELFNLIRHPDGTFSFESQAFPSNFLRMAGVPNPTFNGSGFGAVNCQASIGPYEQFLIEFLGTNQQGNMVAIQSNQFPNNYLRMAGVTPPVFNGAGFGTVNCQAGHLGYEAFHLGGILEQTIAMLVQWYDIDQPTQQQIEDLIKEMITQEQPEGPASLRSLFAEDWHQHSPEELAAIQAIDLAAVSPCTLAICTLVVDILLFVMSIIGIIIMRTNQMIQTAVAALGEAANGLANIIAGIGSNISAAAKATLIFNLIAQIFNGTGLKAIIKGVVNGFSWWGAVIAVLSFIAQVAVWIASGGALLVWQIVAAVVGLAAIALSAVGVSQKCGNVAAAAAALSGPEPLAT